MSGLGKPGKGGYEDRDPYKTKDRQGRTVLCHRCKEPASQQKHKRIVACDFCEYHWHLDCIDPPLAGMPPITRRFMCPAHADEALVSSQGTTILYKIIRLSIIRLLIISHTGGKPSSIRSLSKSRMHTRATTEISKSSHWKGASKESSIRRRRSSHKVSDIKFRSKWSSLISGRKSSGIDTVIC